MNRRALLASGMLSLVGGGLLATRRWGLGERTSSTTRRARSIGDRNGIILGYGPPASFFVSPYGAKDAAIPHGRATAVDVADLEPALDGIEESLRIYPTAFFRSLCGAIFICGSLTMDGAPAGGTYGPAWIILVAAKALGESAIFRTARLGVHHEFSSLVWHRIPDLVAPWRSLMPAGWKPAANNAEALLRATAPPPDPASGFLSAYAATDLENDFNVYAETMFANPVIVPGLAERNPIVARKAALLMAAFGLVDNRMTEVFNQLGLGRFRSAFRGSLSEGVAVPEVAAPVPAVAFPGSRAGRPDGDGRGSRYRRP